MKKRILLLSFFAYGIVGSLKAQTITTSAGDGTYLANPAAPCPVDGGQATATTLNIPNSIKVDAEGSQYIFTSGAGWSCFRIKKIDVNGKITNAVGDGTYGAHYGDGGQASAAGIASYNAFCLDNSGNIYISESWSKPSGFLITSIRKVNSAGIISTINESDTTGVLGDGGPASAATFNANDIVVDTAGNIIMTDRDGGRIRKINTAGIITTIAGNGTQGYSGDGGAATNAQLVYPGQIQLDASGNIYFTDARDVSSPFTSTVLRKIAASGIISTIADTNIMHSYANGLAYEDVEGNIFFSDKSNVVKKLSSAGAVSTVVGISGVAGFNGDNQPAISATLYNPSGLCFDRAGNLFIADGGNYRVRKVMPHTAGISEINYNSNKVRLWPEPNNGSFSLYIPSNENEQVHIIIENIMGQNVNELVSTTNRAINVQLDVSPGLYFVTTVAGTNRQSVKMLVR